VEEEETRYIKKAGDEISILLDIQEPLLSQIVGQEVASIITRLRNGTMKFEPGYDGVYGKPILEPSTQRNLTLD
jgi:PHP family Zn ribbon phosphoesterase